MSRALKFRSAWILVVVLATSLCFTATRDEEQIGAVEVPNFQKVNPNLYRGGQPDVSDIPELAKLGVRTIINLRSSGDKVRAEKEAAIAAGLNFHHIEFPSRGRPSDQKVRRVLDLVLEEENHPVFVHCKRGSDRTGTIVACYRMGYDGWTTENALAEAKHFGMGWWQVGMKQYISDSCGGALGSVGLESIRGADE